MKKDMKKTGREEPFDLLIEKLKENNKDFAKFLQKQIN